MYHQARRPRPLVPSRTPLSGAPRGARTKPRRARPGRRPPSAAPRRPAHSPRGRVCARACTPLMPTPKATARFPLVIVVSVVLKRAWAAAAPRTRAPAGPCPGFSKGPQRTPPSGARTRVRVRLLDSRASCRGCRQPPRARRGAHPQLCCAGGAQLGRHRRPLSLPVGRRAAPKRLTRPAR
ncbi:MAG: hypothetical protein J3K34DRAFT_385835, partial [Monoraphidium minutum]